MRVLSLPAGVDVAFFPPLTIGTACAVWVGQLCELQFGRWLGERFGGSCRRLSSRYMGVRREGLGPLEMVRWEIKSKCGTVA